MNRLFSTIIALAVLLAGGCTSATGMRKPAPGLDDGAQIDIIVSGIHPPEGVVRVALFDSAEGFPERNGGVLRSAEVQADDDAVRISFGELPSGEYAVSVHHDRDGDGRMATDRIGRPLEPYGTSNNVRSQFGPPTFAAAAFTAAGGPLVIEITLVGREDE